MNKLVYAVSQGRLVADAHRLDTLYLIIGKYTFRFTSGRYTGQVFKPAKIEEFPMAVTKQRFGG